MWCYFAVTGVNNSLQLSIADSECSGSVAVGKTVKLRKDDDVNVIIGVPCTDGRLWVLCSCMI